MAEPLAFLNGRFLPAAELLLPLTDPGFAGVGLGDNCRTWNRKLFRWPDHLARFHRDCKAYFVPLPEADLTAAAASIIAANCAIANDDLHLIIIATPNSLAMYTRPVDHARNRGFRKRGAALRVVGHQPVDGDAVLPPRGKHRSRIVWHVAEQLAPDAIAVLLDRPGGTLTETAIANVLAVIDGTLITPPRDLILDGISLRVTLELAEANDVRWKEREIRVDDLQRASEMMLTGTGFGIAGVSRVNDMAMPWPGPVYSKLVAAWEEAVRSAEYEP